MFLPLLEIVSYIITALVAYREDPIAKVWGWMNLVGMKMPHPDQDSVARWALLLACGVGAALAGAVVLLILLRLL